MARVLMLVHGMGVHGADWAAAAMAGLKEAAKPYGLHGALSTELGDGVVTLAPISYDDQFTAWLGRWGGDSRELARFIRTNAIGVPANVVSWLEEVDGEEENFLWSHLVDVLLYRFFSLVTTSVRVHVAHQVARWWRDALAVDPNAEVSVLAYSLGTSVAHDTLALLATDPPPDATGFLAGERQLTNLFMVSNVSRILESTPRVYESVIAPPSVRGDRAYCGSYVDVRHDLDPFPAPRPFAPAWGGADFARIRTRAVRDFDVHSLAHYIRDPRVHVPLFRALFGFDAIDHATAADRIAEHDAATGPECPRRLAEFVQDCRQRVQLIEGAEDVRVLLAAGVQFLLDVEEVRAACGEVV
ncbi:MAG TPA: hypothetical protein VGE02_01595 [Gemmatimonadales bacterium]